MPLLWLRIALALYGAGLLYSLLALRGGSNWVARITAPAVQFGMVFHFVSLAETLHNEGHLTPTNLHDLESLLAFLVMLGFSIIYFRYRTLSPGILVFPAVFLLTLRTSQLASFSICYSRSRCVVNLVDPESGAPVLF